MGCNTVQNEVGGKELLLKAGEAKTVATADTSANITATGHGLKVNDLLKFEAVGALTTFNITNFYFVTEVVDANTIKLSATKGGVAIVADATEAALATDIYKTFGGLRSKTFGFASESVDITNQDSDEWKNMLDGAGVRSFNVSGSGVYTNETVFQSVFTKARANSLIPLMFIDVKAQRVFQGCFKVSSLEVSGDYDAESNYSLSAESSGALTVFTAV